MIKALISIHDVRPDTLEDVLAIVGLMESLGHPPAALLITHGRDWPNEEIDTLRVLSDKGHELVSHGWDHGARHIRGLRHRVHSLLLSRDVAEHLSLSAREIAELLRSCFGWFEPYGLPEPSMYVPPAWGMGDLSRAAMKTLPFRWYEYLTGIYDSEADRFWRLPLVGFEADTIARVFALKALNLLNRWSAGLFRRPMRVAIHPGDLKLGLKYQLKSTLRSSLQSIQPAELHQ